MLVKELIVLLSQYNPEDDVLINYPNEFCGDITVDIDSIELDVMYGALKTSVVILAADYAK